MLFAQLDVAQLIGLLVALVVGITFHEFMHAYVAEPYFCRGCQVSAQGEEWLERHREKVPRGTTMRLVPQSQAQARDPLE